MRDHAAVSAPNTPTHTASSGSGASDWPHSSAAPPRGAGNEERAGQVIAAADATLALWGPDGVDFASLAADIAVEARLALTLSEEIKALDRRIAELYERPTASSCAPPSRSSRSRGQSQAASRPTSTAKLPAPARHTLVERKVSRESSRSPGKAAAGAGLLRQDGHRGRRRHQLPGARHRRPARRLPRTVHQEVPAWYGFKSLVTTGDARREGQGGAVGSVCLEACDPRSQRDNPYAYHCAVYQDAIKWYPQSSGRYLHGHTDTAKMRRRTTRGRDWTW